ncbi:hypothetical protein H4R34_000916 [Dimargaris verticillata]|uniref:Uncharacterized protein n=1 Tax=Dimargaris verticillata TaxID=2761393 RepID=A0A9W8BBS2_9FUNG|nr:hypothetical protein H4R34_000916 [Dimargaris verticillata]
MVPHRGRGGRGGFGRGRGRRPAWPARYPPMGDEYMARPQMAVAPNPYGYMGNYPYEEEYDPAAFGVQMMGYPGVFYPRPYAAGHYPGYGQRASVDATGPGASASAAGMAPSHPYAGWYGGAMDPTSSAGQGQSSGNAMEPMMLSPGARANPAPMYSGMPLQGAFGRAQGYGHYRPFKARGSGGPTADSAYHGLGEGSFDEHGGYLTMPAGSTVSGGDVGHAPAPGGNGGS